MGESPVSPAGTDRGRLGSADAVLRSQLQLRRRRLTAVPGLDHRADIRALLREVDDALARLDGGRFGICEGCHEAIESRRLLADPLTRVCLGCLSEAQARALEHDLESAASIQARLLPPASLNVGRWEVHHHYRPLGPVSGDYVDVVTPAGTDDPLYFLLGDVSGKGVAASLLMANLQAIFRSLVPVRLPLDVLVSRANRLFCESSPPNSFATLVAGRWSPDGELQVCNAGHPPPLLVRAGLVSAFDPTGLPLGVVSDARFDLHRHDGAASALFLAYTDGLAEARNGSRQTYGPRRVQSLVEAFDGRSAHAAVDACLADLAAFLGGSPLADDLTVLAIRDGSNGCC